MKLRLVVISILVLFGFWAQYTLVAMADDGSKPNQKAATTDSAGEVEPIRLLDIIKDGEDPKNLSTVDAAVKKLADQLIGGLDKTKPAKPLKIVVNDLLGPGKDKDLTMLALYATHKLVTRLVDSGKFEKVLERDQLNRLINDQMFEQDGPFKTVQDPADKIGRNATVSGQIIRSEKGLEIHSKIIDASSEVLAKGEVTLPDMPIAKEVVTTTFTVITNRAWSNLRVTAGNLTQETDEGVAIFELTAGERTLTIRGKGIKPFATTIYLSDEDANYYHVLVTDDRMSPEERQALVEKQEKARAGKEEQERIETEHERWKEKMALQEKLRESEFKHKMEEKALEKESRELKYAHEMEVKHLAKEETELAAEELRFKQEMAHLDAKERADAERVAAEERLLAQKQLDEERRQQIETNLHEMRRQMAMQQMANQARMADERRRIEAQQRQLATQSRNLEIKRQKELKRIAEIKRQQDQARRAAELKKQQLLARQRAKIKNRQVEARRKAELRKRQIQPRRNVELKKRQAEARRKAELKKRQSQSRKKAELNKRQSQARRNAELKKRQAEARRQEQLRRQREQRRQQQLRRQREIRRQQELQRRRQQQQRRR